MKMHQFAFVQKCPALTSTALLLSPLNVQLTLSGGKVNMSTAPNLLIAKAELCLCQAFYVSQYFAKSTQPE